MDNLENNVFQTFPALVPGELGLTLMVPQSVIGSFDLPTPFETTYRECGAPEKPRVQETVKMGGRVVCWGDLVFTRFTPGPGGYLGFMFHVNRTPAEVRRPIKELSTPDNQPYQWPNVLVYLSALEDPTQPLTLELDGTVVQVPRLFERLYKVPEQVISTDVDVEVFVSNRPFSRRMVRTNVPVLGEVRYHDRNIEGSLMCLHPYVEFPEVQTGGRKLTGWGTTRSRSPMGNFGRRVYKATNQTTWVDHVIEASPKYDPDSGQWMLTRRTVRVPAGFQVIKDLSN